MTIGPAPMMRMVFRSVRLGMGTSVFVLRCSGCCARAAGRRPRACAAAARWRALPAPATPRPRVRARLVAPGLVQRHRMVAGAQRQRQAQAGCQVGGTVGQPSRRPRQCVLAARFDAGAAAAGRRPTVAGMGRLRRQPAGRHGASSARPGRRLPKRACASACSTARAGSCGFASCARASWATWPAVSPAIRCTRPRARRRRRAAPAVRLRQGSTAAAPRAASGRAHRCRPGAGRGRSPRPAGRCPAQVLAPAHAPRPSHRAHSAAAGVVPVRVAEVPAHSMQTGRPPPARTGGHPGEAARLARPYTTSAASAASHSGSGGPARPTRQQRRPFDRRRRKSPAAGAAQGRRPGETAFAAGAASGRSTCCRPWRSSCSRAATAEGALTTPSVRVPSARVAE
jgi:hypothetical protein